MFHVAFHTYFVKDSTWKLEPGEFDNPQYAFSSDVVVTFEFTKPRNKHRVPVIPELQPYITKYDKKRKAENCTLFDGRVLSLLLLSVSL